MKKLIICNLLAGLIALMYSCGEQRPSVHLLHSTDVNFPSASAIEYYNNKLYLFGDDATYLLVLSTNHQLLDTITYWKEQVERIDKKDKPDIESSMLLQNEKGLAVVGLGSMSGEKRWSAVEYYPGDSSVSITSYYKPQDSFPGIQEINIEGSAGVNNTVVLANRANMKKPDNYLVFQKRDSSLETRKLILPKDKIVTGVSGLFYVKSKDILLLTASEEETNDAVSDGSIGESYLGIISNFSKKMNDTELSPDQFIKLSGVDRAFVKQKVESVCVEKEESGGLILHLVSDNDNGRSRIFKIRVEL